MIERVELVFSCDCKKCRSGKGEPLTVHAYGKTEGDCLKLAVKEGWAFRRTEKGLKCFHLGCVMEDY